MHMNTVTNRCDWGWMDVVLLFICVCMGNSIWRSGTICKYDNRLLFFGLLGWDCCSIGLCMVLYKGLHLGICEEADACLYLLVLVCSL